MTPEQMFGIPARSAFTVGRAGLIGGFLSLLLVLSSAGGARAHPADSILNLLQMGGRESLGLGGDPFLSPLLGESGWWRQELLDGEADVRLRLRRLLPITERLTNGDAEVELAVTRIGARRVFERWGRRLHVGLAASSIRSSVAWNDELAALSAEENGSSIDGLMRFEDILRGLDAQLEFPVTESRSRRSGAALRGGVRYAALADRLHLASSWWRRDCRESLKAVIEGETVDSPYNIDEQGRRHGMRAAPWRELAVELEIGESDYLPLDDLAGGGWEFLPEAWTMSRAQSIEWRPDSGPGLLLRHSDFKLRGYAGGYWQGMRYARLSHWRARIESVLGAAQYSFGEGRRFFVEVEFTDFEVFGRLDIDSWRFAAWQEAWLGAKKVIQLTGDGRLERYHIGAESPWGEWKLGGGLSFYDIYPDARSESWIHIPFVSPQDYERTDLSFSRLSLGAVSMRARRRFDHFELLAEVHQFVYGNDHEDDGESGSEPPVEPPNGGRGDHGGWFGGTYAEVGVGYWF